MITISKLCDYNPKLFCTISNISWWIMAKIKAINPKGNQPHIFTGRTDAEAEAPILWPPDAKSRLIRKDLDAGKD